MRRDRGLTALEIVVPLAIAALVVAAWFTFSSGAAARYAQAPDSKAREQARRALNEMADELRLASRGSVAIETGHGGSRVTFRTTSGGSVVYAVEPSADAARLVRTHDGQTVTMVDGLRPGGFSAKALGGALTLALTPAIGGPLQTAVALREPTSAPTSP